MTPVILLLSSLCYVAAQIAVRRSPVRFRRLDPRLVAPTVAILAAAGVLVATAASPSWSRSTQIAWTGFESGSAGADLRIGGGAQSIIGWPNGAFAPALRFSGSKPGEVEISGGAAFVERPDGRFVNGTALPVATPVRVRDLLVEVQSRWFFWKRIVVRRPSERGSLSQFYVNSSRTDRVLDVALAVNPEVIQLRANRKGADATDLERWAAGLRLLLPIAGDYRILDPDAPGSIAQAPIGERLVVHWPSGTVPLQLHHTADNHLAVYFPPPWRLASPLPPATPGGPAQITLTGQLTQGDTAFLLPLGKELSGFRQAMPLVEGGFAVCRSGAVANPFAQPRPNDKGPDSAGVTCATSVDTGKGILHLATVRDLPSFFQGAIMLGFSFLALILGFILTLTRIRQEDRWTICGIVTTVWMLLLYRGHLALRYAADAAYLDPLAIRGIAMAMIALTVVPGLILLVAPLWRDQSINFKRTDKPYVGLAFYGLILAALAIVQVRKAGDLWPHLPASYVPALVFGGMAHSVLVVGSLYVMFVVFLGFLYVLDPERLPSNTPLGTVLRLCHIAAHTILRLVRTAVKGIGLRLWESVDRNLAQRVSAGPTTLPSPGRFAFRSPSTFWEWYAALVGVVLVLLAAALTMMFLNFAGTEKYVQLVIAPLVFCWIPAVLLLSARTVFTPAGGPRLNIILASVIIVTTLAIAFFVFPFAVLDVGGMVDALSVMLAVTTLLMLGRRHWFIAAIPIVAFVAAAVLAVQLYAQLKVVVNPLSRVGQPASAHLLLWKHGVDVQQYVPFSRVAKAGAAPLPIGLRTLSEAVEHTQENRMMAHEGGYLGLGFANAPTRLSTIRQDTLQSDSTFSFFVLGDDGLVGGVCLLILYAIPLVLVLMSGEALFDVGHGVAMTVTYAWLMAALFHAGMNLGNLPFTARNLPFLSVNSLSDLVLWTILIGAAVQALLWRATGLKTAFAADADSLLNAATPAGPEPRRSYATACLIVASVPAALLIWTGVAGVRLVRDASYDDGRDWSRLLEEVDDMVSRRQLTFNKDAMKIESDRPISGDSVLGQEIEAFNNLSNDDKLDGAVRHGAADFRSPLKTAGSIRDYDQMMSGLRTFDTHLPRPRPSLFALAAPDLRADTEKTTRNVEPDYRLHANPAYNSRTSFHSGTSPEQPPSVALRDEETGQWVLRGNGASVSFSDRAAASGDQRDVTLSQVKSSLSLVTDTRPSGPRATISLRFFPAGKTVPSTVQLGRVEVRADGLYLSPEKLDLNLLPKGRPPAKRLSRGAFVKVEAGDVVTSRDRLNPDFRPEFVAGHDARGALVGSAWARGQRVVEFIVRHWEQLRARLM